MIKAKTKINELVVIDEFSFVVLIGDAIFFERSSQLYAVTSLINLSKSGNPISTADIGKIVNYMLLLEDLKKFGIIPPNYCTEFIDSIKLFNDFDQIKAILKTDTSVLFIETTVIVSLLIQVLLLDLSNANFS